jgi:tRNA nucleotidyltransferase (CCA-adding enzyme)
MTIYIPKDVQNIINIIEAHGHSAYIVGGCVRDAIMGRTPHDYDICTSALPDEILEMFKHRKVIETGLKHGTVTVQGDEDYYEVTTYRVDGEYTDGRHPDEVRFVSDVVEDLSRRDFTINAMAYNAHTGLMDPFHGYDDIQNGLIRCVGNPINRFNEDALRIMRAVRFAATCGFTIHHDTNDAMLSLRHLLVHVSEERKTSEFCKTLVRADVDLLMTYRDVFATFIPELQATFDFAQNNPHHIYDVYTHIAHSVANAPQDVHIRLALMFHDVAKPNTYVEDDAGVGHFYGHASDGAEMSKDIMKRMRLDNDTISIVSDLIASHDMATSTSLKAARRMISKMGEDQARRLIEVMRADKLAQSKNADTLKNLEILDIMENNIDVVKANNECFTLKNLAINGHDLIVLGIKDGKLIGRTLNHLLDIVLAEPEKNVKEILIELALKYVENN